MAMHYLAKKEIGKASLSRNQKLAADLICSPHSTYKSTWNSISSKPMTLLEYVFMNDYSEAHRLDGSLAYKLQLPTSGTKIKDIMGCPNGANDLTSPSFFIALTSDNHLAFFDIETGKLMKYLLLSSKYKFKYIDWNFVNTSLVVKSTKQNRAAALQTTHYIILGIYPIRAMAKFSVRSDLFGTKGTVEIAEGIVYVMFPNDKLECYELKSLLVPIPGVNVDDIVLGPDVEIPDTHELDLSKLVDASGERAAPVPLLSVKSENHFLDFSDSRCYYMIKNSNCIIYHLDTGQLVGEIAVTPEIDEEEVAFLGKSNQVVAKQNQSIVLYDIDIGKREDDTNINNNINKRDTEGNKRAKIEHNSNNNNNNGCMNNSDVIPHDFTTRILKKRFEVKGQGGKLVTDVSLASHNDDGRAVTDVNLPTTPTRHQRKCKQTSPGKILADVDDKIACCTYNETLDLMVVGMKDCAYIYNKNGILVKELDLLFWNDDWGHELSFSSNGEYVVHQSQSITSTIRRFRLVTYRLVL